jgi:hypothetical protein
MFSPSPSHNTIAIFGAPRSGSTFAFHNLVTGLITNHKEYNSEFNHKRLGSEPFRKRDQMQKHNMEYWKSTLTSRWKLFPDSYWTAKFHLLDLMNAHQAGIIDEVLDKTHYKILLLRKNLWESTLSMAISMKKNQWINNLDNKTISLTEEEFLWSLTIQVRNINHLWGDNDFEIKYDQILFTEDLTDDPSDVYEKITGSRLVLENTVEKSPNKESVIINLDEIRSVYEQADKHLHGKATLEGDMVNYNE